jgi:hypothetical protein
MLSCAARTEMPPDPDLVNTGAECMLPAHTVLFALQSALKLGGQAREAYVDAARGRELLLPLPSFNPSPGIGAALSYFRDAADRIDGPPRLLQLLSVIEQGTELSDEQKEELKAFHSEQLLLEASEAKGEAGRPAALTREALQALVTVRQWERGCSPHPSVLQRLAGSFVEIGIDYFSQVPGALNESTKRGKALLALFRGLDSIHFATEPLGNLPGQLMVSTLEVIAEQSEALSSDPRVQEIIAASASSLATDVHERIQEIRQSGSDSLLEERVRSWAELVFRSLLGSGGRLVVDNPARYLGIKNQRDEVLVSSAGGAVLAFVLDNDLDGLLSREALDAVLKASLTAVGDHPELFLKSDNQGLKLLLGQIASRLSRFESLLTPDILPELTRFILEKTGKNLPLLWPDLENDPGGHVLLQASATTLEILSQPPQDEGVWQPAFSRQDILRILETVLETCAEEPGWLIEKAGQVNDNLSTALEAALGAIRSKADLRLSPHTSAEILQAAFLAVGRNAALLDQVPDGRRILGVLLETLLSTFFDPELDRRAAWLLLRQEVVLGLVRTALFQLTRTGLSEAHLAALQQVLENEVTSIAQGKPWDMDGFEMRLSKALEPLR